MSGWLPEILLAFRLLEVAMQGVAHQSAPAGDQEGQVVSGSVAHREAQGATGPSA